MSTSTQPLGVPTIPVSAIPISSSLAIGIMALGYYARLAGLTAQIQGIDGIRLATLGALKSLYSSNASSDTESESDEEEPPQGALPETPLTKELRKYVRMMDNEIKLVIHRAYLVRRTIAMVLITISLFFMSGMSALLAWYTSVFWWFSAICLLIGLTIFAIGVAFALAELRISLIVEEEEYKYAMNYGNADNAVDVNPNVINNNNNQ